MTWSPSDLSDDPVWLLDLELGGRLYRYATSPISLLDQDGTTHVFDEGLVDIVAPRSPENVALELHADEDWESARADGMVFESQPATLRRVVPGMLLEQARTYIRGKTADVVIGFPSDPGRLALTIEPRSALDTRQVPTPDMQITSTTYSAMTLDDQTEGAFEPVVFGFPGSAVYPAWPGIYMEKSGSPYVLASRVADGDATHAGPAFVFEMRTDGTQEAKEFNTTTLATLSGRVFADLGDPTGTGFTNTPAFGRRYWLSASAESGHNQAVQLEGNPVRGAGDVLLYIAQTYGAGGFDLDAMRRHARSLNRYKIDTVLNSPSKVWDWARSTILSILPVVEREGPGGTYVEPIPTTVALSDIEVELHAPRDIERVEAPRRIRPIYNDFTIEYAPKLAQRPTQTRRITGDIFEQGKARTAVLQVLRDSHLRYGQRIAPTIRTGILWDTPTATQILQDLAALHALPWFRVIYDAPWGAEWIREGARVRVYDGSIDGSFGVVGSPTVGGPSIRVPIDIAPKQLSEGISQ